MDITNTVVMIVVLLVILVALLFIQIQLSKRNNDLLAYVLPALFFIRSLITTISVIGTIGTALMYFLFLNIPTVLLLLIHVVVRKRKISDNQLNKMNIKDL